MQVLKKWWATIVPTMIGLMWAVLPPVQSYLSAHRKWPLVVMIIGMVVAHNVPSPVQQNRLDNLTNKE